MCEKCVYYSNILRLIQIKKKKFENKNNCFNNLYFNIKMF